MKKILLIATILAIASCFGYSQTREDFIKSRNSSRQNYVAEKNKEYQKYLAEINNEFAEYLKEQWSAFDVQEGMPLPLKPQPVEPVSVIPSEGNPEDADLSPELEQILYDVVIQAEDLEMSPKEETNFEKATKFIDELQTSIIDMVPEYESSENMLSSEIYNTPINVCMSEKLSNIKLSDIHETQVGNFWNQVMTVDDNYQIIGKCQQLKENLKLNDWGYYLICKNAAENIFGDNYNEKTVYTVFLLCQSGYNAKVARCKENLIIMLPFYQNSYCQKYIESDGIKYYMFNFNDVPVTGNNTIYTYNKIFNEVNSKRLNLLINDEPQFNAKTATKALSYGNDGEIMNFNYNSNLIDYYKDYPLVDLKVYFNAALSKELSKSVKSCLQPLVEGKSEQLSVNTLLDFMYTSFDNYKSDDEQFGHEKWFFCEEMLYYPFNDCEDRAVFFANLVSKLLGLDVVLLEYPYHVAAAVCFKDDEVKGKYLMYDNKKYVVCDPTYFGAYAGLEMPEVGEPVVISR